MTTMTMTTDQLESIKRRCREVQARLIQQRIALAELLRVDLVGVEASAESDDDLRQATEMICGVDEVLFTLNSASKRLARICK